MALQDKYVLEFDDINGNEKKLVIQKEGWASGNGLIPLTGTENPVKIRWEGKRDIYHPIIGSTCNINLWEPIFQENLVTNNTKMNVSSSWTTATGQSVSANSIDPPFSHVNSPTGANTEEADRLTGTVGLTSYLYQDMGALKGQHTYSVYVKKYLTNDEASLGTNYIGTGTDVWKFTFSTETLTQIGDDIPDSTAGFERLSNGWYRIYFHTTFGDTNTNNVRFYLNYGNGLVSNYWGAQVNRGTTPHKFIYTSNIALDNTLTDLRGFGERDFRAIIYYTEGGTEKELWRGFLKVDTHIETFEPNPVQIKLQATDGIGELEGFTMEWEQNSSSGVSLIKRLGQIITNTGLDLPIRYSCFDRYRSESTTYNNLVIALTHLGMYENGFKLKNNKDVLTGILKQFNLRIFQSKGYFYIVSNNEYSDFTLLDNQSTSAFTNETQPTGIRASETSNLTTNGTEYPKFINYALDGTKGSEVTNIDILKEVNTDLIPLERSLQLEFRPPVREVQFIQDLKDANLTTNISRNPRRQITRDGGFEVYTNQWTVNQGSIDSHTYRSGGNRSYKLTSPNSSTLISALVNSNTLSDQVTAIDGDTFKIKMRVYIDVIGKNENNVTYNEAIIPVTISRRTPSTTEYYNFSTNNWVSVSTTHVDFKVNTTDRWVDVEKSFNTTIGTQYQYGIVIYLPDQDFTTGSGIVTPDIYLDHVYIERTRGSLKNKIAYRYLDGGSRVIKINYDFHASFGNQIRILRPRDNWTSNTQTPEETQTQVITNDNREPLKVYDGKFRHNGEDAISPLNKLWFNFSDGSYVGEVSAMIDKCIYNVKASEYDITCHEPNQDDDVSSTFVEKSN